MPPVPHWKAQQDTLPSVFCSRPIFQIKIVGGAWVSHNTPWTGGQTGHTARSRLLDSLWTVGENTRGHKLSIHAPETSEQQLQPVPARQVTVHETNKKKRLIHRSCGTRLAHFLLSLLLSAAVLSHIGQQTLRKRSQTPNTRLSPHGCASWWDWSVTSSDESKDAVRVNIYCR